MHYHSTKFFIRSRAYFKMFQHLYNYLGARGSKDVEVAELKHSNFNVFIHNLIMCLYY